MKAPWLTVTCALALLLAGCASEPQVMRLHGTEGEMSLVFPARETGEVPRYRYMGQLIGDVNFQTVNGSRITARKFLAWVVGLGEHPDERVVLQRPQTGTVDSRGRVLVTDISRNAVFVFDEVGGKLEVWERATPARRFEAPVGITTGRGGEVLVADAELASVFRFSPEGTSLGQFGAGLLTRPTGIARDPARGRIYVADTHEHDIKVFDDDGKLVAIWGRRGELPGEFNFPTHLSFAPNGLMVTDSMNARIQVLDPEGKPTLVFGERGPYVGNLVRPKGVAADDEGNLYVIESMHDTLLIFDAKARLLMPIGGTGPDAGSFYLPAGVWTDSRNRIYVADMFNGRVSIFQFLGGD